MDARRWEASRFYYQPGAGDVLVGGPPGSFPPSVLQRSVGDGALSCASWLLRRVDYDRRESQATIFVSVIKSLRAMNQAIARMPIFVSKLTFMIEVFEEIHSKSCRLKDFFQSLIGVKHLVVYRVRSIYADRGLDGVRLGPRLAHSRRVSNICSTSEQRNDRPPK